ncbi:MAG: hypothetical protein ETSY1_04165 [Candidatus Entotheonella factor]|uniref:Uncharacterized protein n=1 Tax=Entotheonella factor TaxID=1429438 RepID=W4LWN0_ENTF1|nr:hypothetical protein [Candidatus Entotheonella palauensis]ETX02283.1 MAG: hypothetical protein ETSY1_04165 [Candidatus Entotheonella factor]
MSADPSENPSSAPVPEPQHTSDSLQEPHLLNIDSVLKVAQWLALAAASGVVGSVAYDLLNSIRRRFGRSRLDELESKVYDLLQQQRSAQLTDEEMRHQVRELFKQFE